MSDLRSRVAYLHGLAEGLDLDGTSTEGRVLTAVIDVLGDLADAMEDVSEAQDELADYVEEMDEDLSAMEESQAVIAHEDGVEMVCCPECGEALSGSAGEVEEEFEVTCPVCGCSLQAVEEDE